MNSVALVLLAGVLAAAVFSDVVSRRIPNKLVLTGLLLASAWHSIAPAGAWAFDPARPGSAGLLGCLFGAAAMLAAFLPFYALRVMGAGDVKLLAVVGAFFGARPDAWIQLPGVALCVLAAGGVLALFRMLASRQSAKVLGNVAAILSRLVAPAGAPAFDARVQTVDRMPYAIAIALGVFSYVAGKWTGWIKVL